jgi:hypothetical protein
VIVKISLILYDSNTDCWVVSVSLLSLLLVLTYNAVCGSLIVYLLADCEGFELFERKTEDHSPRREAEQHSARQTRQH